MPSVRHEQDDGVAPVETTEISGEYRNKQDTLIPIAGDSALL